jgi:hypothetical protein
LRIVAIPNDKIQNLPQGSRVLVNILEENRWAMCTVTADQRGKGLVEEGSHWVLAYLDNTEGYLAAYGCFEEDKISELKNVAVHARMLYEMCADFIVDFARADRFVWAMGELEYALVKAGY